MYRKAANNQYDTIRAHYMDRHAKQGLTYDEILAAASELMDIRDDYPKFEFAIMDVQGWISEFERKKRKKLRVKQKMTGWLVNVCLAISAIALRVVRVIDSI